MPEMQLNSTLNLPYILHSQLKGCINDTINVKEFIMRNFGFTDTPDTMVWLTDEQRDPGYRPTRQNMIQALRWLVRDARPGDSCFLHYSGHGGQQKCTTGEETSGMDETIVPLDYQQTGMIIDNEINDILVRPLPPGCRLTVIFDSCHSQGALDLPYVYAHDGSLKKYNPTQEIGHSLMSAGMAYMSGNEMGALKGIMTGVQSFMQGGQGKQAEEIARQRHTSPADVIMFR